MLASILAAACIGATLSVGAWYAVAQREDRLAEAELGARASSHALLLESGIKQYLDKVIALRALFESDDHVSREEFQLFSNSILRDQRAILGVKWIPRVTRDQRAAHERQGVEQGLSGYHLKTEAPDGSLVPSADLPEHFPVFYSSNEAADSPIYGLDLADGGIRQQTLDRAVTEDGIAVSENFLLRAGQGDRNGFFAVMPVFQPGVRYVSPESRRDNLVGFVQGVFQIGVLIESILQAGSTPGALDLYFYWSGQPDEQRPIYFHPSRVRKAHITARPRAALDAGPHWTDALQVGDRKWTLVAVPIPGGPGTPNHFSSWAVLAVGLFVSALVAAYIWLLGRYALRVQMANKQLDEQNTQLDTALSNMTQGLLMFDSSGRLIMHNRRYGEMYGLSPEVIKPGCSLRDLLERRREVGALPDSDPDRYFEDVLAAIKEGKTFEWLTALPDGRTVAVANRPIPGGGWVATHHDVTERLRAQARISHLAKHDALTDLPNRVFFHSRLDQALKGARDEKLAVLCLDIDDFKAVNDALGHPIGDMLLTAVAGRLRQCIRDCDTVARIGGDEFAVIQVGVSQPNDATRLAARLIETVSAPYELDGHHVVVGLSIGVAIPPVDGNGPDLLLKNADMALYRAKSDGRGVFRFFEPEMNAKMQARRTLELALRSAVAEGQFEVYYQPLINIETGRVRSFEALIRWHRPGHGIVAPADFIALAEETGLIVPIGEWVLRQACKEAAAWPADVSVAINLSAVQFKNRKLLATVVSVLAASGLPPSRLELEITELLLLQDSEDTLAVLHQLRGLGIRISMDDFGTGYSSLAYLQKFPFDKIKIDRSFVRDMTTREESMAIVRAVAAMGASLGMMTTAEGVETVEQFDRLKAEGCTEVQGYLFSPPLPASKVEELLRKHNPRMKAIA